MSFQARITGDREGKNDAYSAPRLNLSLKDFELLRVLGDGSMSTVFHAVLKSTKEEFALKVIDKFYIQRHKMTDSVVRERNIMDMLHSNWIVRLRFTFQDSQKLYMAMDMYRGGDLFEQVQLRKPLPIDDVRFYAAEMVLMIECLRQNRVVFRDFKPENMLLTDTGHLVLTDFGCAKVLEPDHDAGVSSAQSSAHGNGNKDSAQQPARGSEEVAEKRKVTFVGTADYLCPEILKNTGCSFAVDLWGLGCIIFQMVTGTPPFRDNSQYLIMQRIDALDYTFPEGFPAEAEDLVACLLIEEPSERLGARDFEELKRHQFFHDIDWENLRSQKAPDFVEFEHRHNDADLWEMRALQDALPANDAA